ncbi:MAG: hypothetical protein R2712_27815 [Vicinamibacterales bacterium]
MSDYCGTCAFDPRTTCPVTPLYWAFLDRHRNALGENPRMRLPLRSLDKRPADRRAADAALFDAVTAALADGRRLDPSQADLGGHGTNAEVRST